MAIALVAGGTVANGTTSVTPSYGATTGAGNLLVCLAFSGGTTSNFTTATSGWSSIIVNNTSALFYKPNSSGSDAAPTITAGTGDAISALLAEFSGAATTSPLDQNKGKTTGFGSSPNSLSMDAADANSGSLIVSVVMWVLSKSGTATTTCTYNNGATSANLAQNDSTSTGSHYRLSYGVTTGTASADNDSETNDSMNLSSGSMCIASFKPLTVPPGVKIGRTNFIYLRKNR